MTDATSNDVEHRALPDPFTDQFQVVLGLERPPETVGDWTTAVAAFLADAGLSIGPEDLCTTGASPHVARFDGDRQHYRCVLDALLVPFVHDDPGQVTVRSETPFDDDVVEATVTRQQIEVEPETAVASLGVDADAPPATAFDASPIEAYDLFCPYVNAFMDREEYDRWAADTAEAVTTAVPLEDAFEIARLLTDRAPSVSSG